MPKNKRKTLPDVEELMARPICYYCEKDFEDLSYLIDHQRAKHYKCDRCNRRLNTAGGLGVHMSQVHKEKLELVANALPGREKPDVEIFGMEGFPADLLAQHKARVMQEFFKRESDHRAKTGNNPAGSKGDGESMEKKIEDSKKRIAEFKARKAAAKAAAAANGSASGGSTPAHAVNSPAPVQQFSPAQAHSTPPTAATEAGAQYAPSYPGVNAQYPAMQNTPAFNPQPHAMPYSGGPVTASGTSPPAPISSIPRPSSLPSAPGLPQRPAFDSPSFSKGDMARMHSGQAPPPGTSGSYHGAGSPPAAASYAPPYGAANPAYGMPNPPYGAPAPHWAMQQSPSGVPPGPAFSPSQGGPGPFAQSHDIKDSVDELIESITSGNATRNPAAPSHPQAVVQQPPPNNAATETSTPTAEPSEAATSNKKKAKKDNNIVLKYSDEQLSPEEKRAKKSWEPSQEWKDMMSNLDSTTSAALSKNSLTMVDQAGEESSAAVTGPVDDAMQNGDIPMD